MSSQFPAQNQKQIVTHESPVITNPTDHGDILARLGFHYPDADTIPYRAQWNDTKGMHTPLVKHLGLQSFGRVSYFVDTKGREGYVLGCGEYGNIVVFQRYADNPTYWMINPPVTTHEYGRIVGEQRPLTLAGLNALAAVYGSILDRETRPEQWFVPAAHR